MVCEPLILNSNLEAVAVRLKCHTEITICNVYFPQNSENFNLNKRDVEHLLSQLQTPFILTGDFNALNIIWGNNLNCARGKFLEEIIDNDNNISLLNNGKSTHFCLYRGTFSALDLTLCSTTLLNKISWNVLDHPYGSDHMPIIIDYLHSLNQPANNDNRSSIKNRHLFNTGSQKWVYQNANWDSYSKHFLNNIPLLSKNVEIDTNTIKTSILEAAQENIPKLTFNGQSKHKIVPWWNQEVRLAIREYKAFWYYCRQPQNNNMENRILLKQLKAKSRRVIKQAKQNTWTQFTQSINEKTPTTEVWRKINLIKSKKHGCNEIRAMESGSIIYTDPEDIANCLANHFSSTSSTSNYTTNFQEYKRQIEMNPIIDENINTNEEYNLLFTLNEFDFALQSCRSLCTGIDGVSYKMIEQLPENMKLIILEHYNNMWQQNEFPYEWKIAIVLPLLKPGQNPSSPNDRRPISLTCCLSKLIEKMVSRRLRFILEKHHIIIPPQCGFRNYHSTADCLSFLQNEVLNAFHMKEHLIAIFFDIKKAYDMAWRHRIILKLQEYNIRGHMLKFIINFLQHRRFKVKNGSILSNTFTLENGIPQGSVLSVILFLVAINDINSRILYPIQTLCFADDFVMFCRDRDVIYLGDVLQEAITNLEEWCNRSGFTFSNTKTKCMHFKHRAPQQSMNPPLTLYDQQLEFVTTIRYLGVILDQKLSWIPHFKYVKQNCTQRVNVLKYLSNQGWGADRVSLMKVFKSFICTKINYASVAYSSARKSSFQIIDVIFNKCLRIVSGAFHTSPIKSIFCEAGELPTHIRRDIILSKYCFKLLQHKTHILHIKVKHPHLLASYSNPSKSKTPYPFPIRFHQLLSEFTFDLDWLMCYEEDDAEKIAPWTLKKPKINTSLTTFKKGSTDDNTYKQNLFQQLEGTQEFTKVFTDGSKNLTGTGCGFTDTKRKKDYIFPMHKMTSIYTAELYCILQALVYINRIDAPNSIIFTDSLSSLQIINQTYPKNQLVMQIQQIIHNILINNRYITLFWIPSHIGISGNELADDLANRAANLNSENDQTSTITSSDATNAMQRMLSRKWEIEWREDNDSKLRAYKPYTQRYTTQYSRKHQLAITRTLIGHCKITHAYLLDSSTRLNPPECNRCRQIITIRHILFECQLFTIQRRQHRISEIEDVEDKTTSGILTKLRDYLIEIKLINEM